MEQKSQLPDPRKIKLIATDLDGTLLNSNGVVSERTKNVISKILKKYPDIYFVLASGRARPAVQSIRKDLELQNYANTAYILLNGCIVYSNNESILWQSNLKPEIILEHCEYMKKMPNIDYIYSSGDDAVMFNDKWQKLAIEKFQEKAVVFNNDEFVESVKKGERVVNKICFLSQTTKELESIATMLSDFKGKYDLECAYSASIFMEYMPKNVNKGEALKKLTSSLKIKKEEIITFGDGGNDIELIEEAGWGVAMQNAEEKVKQHAKIIAKSNIEDGVAEVLENIFLKDETN